MYWQYLPRKVVYKKGSKVVPSMKTGFDHKRSTVTLACTAWGDLLKPALILRRKTDYRLKCENKIDILLQKSDNGWSNTKTFTEWIEKILLPFIENNECLLIMDSYEGHINQDIRKFLKSYPKIHTLIIPDGYTDVL